MTQTPNTQNQLKKVTFINNIAKVRNMSWYSLDQSRPRFRVLVFFCEMVPGGPFYGVERAPSQKRRFKINCITYKHYRFYCVYCICSTTLAPFSNFKRQHSGRDHDQQKWWLGNLIQHTIVQNPGHLGYPTCFKFGQAQADANFLHFPCHLKTYSSHLTFSYTSSWVPICNIISAAWS